MFDASWHEGEEEKVEAFVVRKDPPASLLETDREAEYGFYATFWGSTVPVPRMRWLESDASILGGPFFIMDRILECESATRVIIAPPFTGVQPEIARNMYEILAAISTFDWHGSPAERVAEVPTPESAWQKELYHWERIINEQELSPQPVMRGAIRWLRANPPPPAQRVSVVHGDYRVGNFLYRADGSIHGIVDWEMAHFGDPIEDLAWSFNESWQWAKDGRPGGIVDLDTAIRIWERASGLTADPAALQWWEVFGHVKCQGIWLTGAAPSRRAAPTSSSCLSSPTRSSMQDQYLLRTMGGFMRPDRDVSSRACGEPSDERHAGGTHPFGQQTVGIAGSLAMMVAEEFDRAADRLVAENRILRSILADGLRSSMAKPPLLCRPPSIRAGAGLPRVLAPGRERALRAGLVVLHAGVEAAKTPEAHAMDERVWDELIESTRRREFQSRLI